MIIKIRPRPNKDRIAGEVRAMLCLLRAMQRRREVSTAQIAAVEAANKKFERMLERMGCSLNPDARRKA